MADHDADNPVETGRQKAENTAEAVKSRAATLGEQAKAGASSLASGARARVETEVNARAEGARDTVAGAIEDTAETLRTAADRMSDDTPQSEAVYRAANTVSGVATQVRETDFASLSDDLSATARRHPAVFLAGAGLLGFAAGRFLRASDRPTPASSYDAPPAGYPGRATGPSPAPTPRPRAPAAPMPRAPEAPGARVSPATTAPGASPSPTKPSPSPVSSGATSVDGTPGKGG